jgi:hypothetical protein
MFDKEISQNDYAILAPKDEESVTQEEDFDVTEEDVVEVTEDDKFTEQLKKRSMRATILMDLLLFNKKVLIMTNEKKGRIAT